MALNSVTFGSFEPDYVSELLQNNTEADLDFVWQRKCPISEGELVSGCSALLNVPPARQLRSYSPGGSSPNIPPNPPTTPVEDTRITPSKLNVNATPFVPSHVSVIGGEGGGGGGGGGGGDEVPSNKPQVVEDEERGAKKQLDFTVAKETTTTPAKPVAVVQPMNAAPPSSSGDALKIIAADDKLIESESTAPANSSPPRSESQHVMVGSLECDLVQTVGQSSATAGDPLLSDMTRNGEGPCEGVEFYSSTGLSEDSGTGTSSVSHSEKSIPQSVCSSTSTRTNSLSTENNSQNSESLLTPSHTPSTPSQQATPTSITPTSSLPTSPTLATAAGASNNNRTTKSWASIVSSKATTTIDLPPPPPPPSTATQAATGGKMKGPAPSSSGSTKTADCEPAPVGGGDAIGGGPSTQLKALGEFLSSWSPSHAPVSILPRGLTNQGNWCYTHAPLQALLGIPALHNTLRQLSPYPALSRSPSPTPLVDCLIQFVHEFEPFPKSLPPAVMPEAKTKKRRRVAELVHGEPFRPDYVYSVLPQIRASLSHKGRQEDAEEFLGCVLDRLHEEMVLAKRAWHSNNTEQNEEGQEEGVGVDGGSSEGGEAGEGGEDEWEQVGPKNKSTVTRQLYLSESPITEIFGGELRSAVHRAGARESATVEPFLTLQLDIQRENTWGVRDALNVMATKETVHMNAGSNMEVEVHKRLTLARLPPVLTLHLKRFVFNKTSSAGGGGGGAGAGGGGGGGGGSQKVLKFVQYTIDLEIGKDLLAPAIRHKLAPNQRQYKLWAVVYHHGKSATGGHYTSDVFHPACGGWVRMDDGLLKMVPEEFVLRPSQGSNKVAYLLFYRRLDTIRT